MRPMNMKNATSMTQLLLALTVAITLLFTPAAFAAAPGITSTAGTAGTFNLTAQDGYLNQPDGEAVYSWGYGCVAGSPTFVPAAIAGAFCNSMQVPGPTMVVTEGATVTISLTNNLPTAAGNTSILFPGFLLTSTCANTAANPQGLLACEAAPGQTITYTFVASAPGTHPYYSGTQGDLQIEMGLYGAVIVLPATPPAVCSNGTTNTHNLYGKTDYGTASGIQGFPESDFRLSTAAYDHPKSCYDREYLFQWAEMDSRIHRQAQAQVMAKVGCSAGVPGCSLDVQTEPYHPQYFLINGRSMPDLMDPNYASEYPHQPYNGNPHIHPGELMLIRTIGQGRWQHPYHEHANHVRILARDGNLILTPLNPTTSLAGQLMFNTDTTPGESFDGIFYFTGRGLNWDPYGHHPPTTPTSALTITALSEVGNTVTATVTGTTLSSSLAGETVTIANASIAGYNGSFVVTAVTSPSSFSYIDTGATGLTSGNSGSATFSNPSATSQNPFPTDSLASLACTPDANGYNTLNGTSVLNYYEWCQDHNKPVQVNPFGDVGSGGPITFPDPNVFTNGAWYGGTPYLGPDASLRAAFPACGTTTNAYCTPLQPANLQVNPSNERGWAFMWHSHNEREITTNNVFPGGMLMMLLVDTREFAIDETQ